MKFLSNARMRNKLLFILLPPCLFLLVFVGIVITSLVKDVQTLRWNRNLRKAIHPFEEMNEILQDEEFASINYLVGDQVDNLRELRLATDAEIIKFKTELAAIEKKDLAYLSLYENRIINELSNLSAMRRRVDNRSIDAFELDEFFGNIQTTSLDAINSVNRLYHVHPTFTKPHEAFIRLLHEKFAFQRQNVLVEKALIDNTISTEHLIKLVQLVEAERLYHESFKTFATSLQIDLYDETIMGPSLTQTNEITTEVLKGNFSFDYEVWANAESHKITLYRQVINDIQENIHQHVTKTLYKDFIELAIVILLVLTLFIFIFFFALKIVRDITFPLDQLKIISTKIEGKNLTEFVKLSERDDELGDLEKSFGSLSQTLLSIILNLKNEITTVTQSSSDIVNVISKLSTAQQETENAIIETNATMEELRQTSGVSTKKAQEVLGSAKETLEALKASLEAIKSTVEDLNQIQEKMGVISESTTKLNEHCQAIGGIIDSVHDLAEQSHVLAVNASIEAAKAGEQGKGFAVVAQEVRNLAEQSKQATTKVHAILTDIQNSMNTTVLATEQGSLAVKNGVDRSANTTEIMNTLSGKVDVVINATQEITSSSEQQFTAVNQTTEAITNIKTASGQQTELTHNIEQNIAALHRVSETLKNLIQEFALPEEKNKKEDVKKPPQTGSAQPTQENKDGSK